MVSILLLVIIYIAFISLGLPDSLLGATWPSMYHGFGVPISYAGIISVITSGGTILSSFFSTRMIRKFGTGIVTVISVFMTAAALLGISVSHNFVQMCIYAVPLGLGAGCVDSGLNNYVALHYKAKHMSWLHCFWGVGASIGPMVISYWIMIGNWQMGYRSIGIFQVILVMLLLISLPLWHKVAKESMQNNADYVKPESLTFMELLRLPGAKAALASFFCYCSIEATAGLWGSSFLVVSRGISAKTAASWISLYYFGITFGRFLSGFITMKLNQKQMIRMGQIILAAGIALLLIPNTNALLIPGFFMIGLGCAPIFPSLLHETPENFGAEYSQAIMGIQMAFAYIGTTFMPPLFGFLASHFGYGLFQFYIGGILILMIIMVERLHSSKHKAARDNQISHARKKHK